MAADEEKEIGGAPAGYFYDAVSGKRAWDGAWDRAGEGARNGAGR